MIREAGDAGLRALQLFSRNPVGGQSRELPRPGALRGVFEAAGVETFYVHAPYFVNPAATNPDMLQRARVTLKQEMRRAKRLGAHYVVLHPGHWQEASERGQSLAMFAGTVVTMLEAPGRVLVENNSGQGKEIGAEFVELRQIFEAIGRTRRVGLMLDTAHAMAAGHRLDSREDVDHLLQVIETHVGLDRVAGIHLNDSLHPVGSHKDRHAHLLEGHLGQAALRAILMWADQTECPLILETPGRDVDQRQEDLAIIHEMLRGT